MTCGRTFDTDSGRFGVVLGLLGSLGVMKVLASQLWNVSPRDPVTLATVVGAMSLAALAASYFPPVARLTSIRSSRCEEIRASFGRVALPEDLRPRSTKLSRCVGHAGDGVP
jgi:hypothetical protein